MMKRLLFIISVMLPICSTANAATIYVSKAGSNTSPYDTWAKASTTPNRTVAAGDTMLIGGGGGTYFNVSLTIPTGSTESDRTYFLDSAYAANGGTGFGTCMLSAADTVPKANWSVDSGNRYVASFTPTNTFDVSGYGVGMIYTVSQNGTLLTPQASAAAVDAAGEFFYNDAGDLLYIYCVGSVNPNTVEVQASAGVPIHFTNDAMNYIVFGGIGAMMGKQGVVRTDSDDAPDSVDFYYCRLSRVSMATNENPAIIHFHGDGGGIWDSSGAWYNTYARFFSFDHCSIGVGMGTGTEAHQGSGVVSYNATNIRFSNSIFHDLISDGCEIKNSESGDGQVAAQFTFANCTFTNIGQHGVNIYTNAHRDSVYGCIFDSIGVAAIGIGQSSAGNDDRGDHVMRNNTFYKCNQALKVRPNEDVPRDYAPYTGEFKYNVVYDKVALAADQGSFPSIEHSFMFDLAGATVPLDIWIDSNQYYDPSASFIATWGSTTTRDWTYWQGTADNDSNGLNTDPGLNTTTFATTSAGTMSRTYGGQDWTVWGAIQPEGAITDSCIQITGKTTLALSDTCYCIVDSLLYTFAQRDTLINTGGHDNIRIWGSHTGGGRGIIAYSASDTGSLSWPTDSALSAVVIHVVNSDSVTIGNLAIVPRTIPDSVRQIVCVNGLTVRGLYLDNDSVVTAGFSSRAFQESTTGGSSSMNMLLENSYFGTTSKGYNRRDQLYGATVLAVAGLKTDGMYEYLLHVRNSRIFSVHTGIGIAGDDLYPVFYIDSNTITVDSRNDLYMTYDDNDVNNSNGDPYGIGIDGSDSLSRITGNTINSVGGTYYGGDGMLLQHISASATNRFEVYNNTITLEHGVHPRIAAGRQSAVGFYVRNYASTLFVKGLHLHDNTIRIVLDTNEATTYRGYLGEGIRLGFENGSTGNLIENNRVNIVAADSATRTTINTMEGAALSINQRDTTYAGDELTLNNVVRYNWLRSPKNPIWLGDTRVGYGANNITFEGDTVIATYVGDSTFVRFHQSSTYFDHHRDNKLKGMVLQGYANADDVIKGTIPTTPDSLGKQLSYVQDITVNFKDVSSANISGGTVWAIDDYGHRFDFPNTDGSGNSLDELRFRFFGYDALADGFTVEDSSLYNPFTFWAKSGSDSTSDTMSVGWSASAINLQLPDVSIMNIIRGISLQGVVIK